jgi:hypothetical protein
MTIKSETLTDRVENTHRSFQEDLIFKVTQYSTILIEIKIPNFVETV